MTNETWTIKKILDWTQSFFQSKGIESARLDAEILLGEILQLGRMDLYLKFDRPLAAQELADYKALIKRRAELEPVAHIVGKKEFYSRDFKVSSDVLIPRPDTEVLVEQCLQRLSDEKLSGLEIGMGSGCIGITLLCEKPHLHLKGIDVSAPALSIAKENAESHGVADRLQLQEQNFLSLSSRPTDGSGEISDEYDFIVSNPPYCAEHKVQDVDPGVLKHEPHVALMGGDQGLNFYGPIANFAKERLKSGGFVAVEIGEEQGPAVKELFENAGLDEVVVVKDYAQHDRVVIGFRNG